MDIFDLTTDFLVKQKLKGENKIYISAENVEIFKNLGVALPLQKIVNEKIIQEPQPIVNKESAKPIFEVKENITPKTEEIEKSSPTDSQNQNAKISLFTTGKNKNPQILFIEETIKFIENQPPFFYGAETLQKMTENVIFVKWENVATTSLIKPQLPKNNFDLTEIETLLQNLISNVKPKFIVVCSSLAAKALLKNFNPINKSHGILNLYKNIPIIEIFHPEYLNRFPQFKKLTMPDLKTIKKTLDES